LLFLVNRINLPQSAIFAYSLGWKAWGDDAVAGYWDASPGHPRQGASKEWNYENLKAELEDFFIVSLLIHAEW